MATLDEYRTIQDKIDRIGDFRFRIKGWSVTLVTGLVLGNVAASTPPVFILMGIPVVLLFWLLERQQVFLQSVLSARVRTIERQLKDQQLEIAGTIIRSMVQMRRKNMLLAFAEPLFYCAQLLVIGAAFVLRLAVATPGKNTSSGVIIVPAPGQEAKIVSSKEPTKGIPHVEPPQKEKPHARTGPR